MKAKCPKCSYVIEVPEGAKPEDYICMKHGVTLKEYKEEKKPKKEEPKEK